MWKGIPKIMFISNVIETYIQNVFFGNTSIKKKDRWDPVYLQQVRNNYLFKIESYTNTYFQNAAVINIIKQNIHFIA